MAQLPNLAYGQTPPMSSESFVHLAKSLITKNDFIILDNLSPDKIHSNNKKIKCDFIIKLQNWEYSLCYNLAQQRAIKLKRDVSMEKPPVFHIDVIAIALKAVDEHSSLDGEIFLDKARWQVIENFAGNDYFNRNNVFAYYLKLLLLERRQSFDADTGFAEYKSLYNSILGSVQNSGDQ